MGEKLNIGIDLGTTYSSVSVWDRTEPKLVLENNNASSFPSYIVLTKDQMNRLMYLYGQAAKNQAVSHAFFDSKRLIGKTYKEYEALGTETNDWNFGVTEDSKGYAQMMTSSPENNNRQEVFYPEEVSGMILMSLIKLVKQRFPNVPIGNVVVTVPVKFTPAQRNATIRACKIAGIENVELMNEPSASIVEYKRYLEKERRGTLTEGTKILVIDFGGGTLDVCCCKIGRKSGRNETNIQVLATGGDQDLGGKHFDEVVRDIIMENIREDFSEAIPMFTEKSTDTLRAKKAKKTRKWKVMIEAEKAKIELSKTPCVSVPLEPILGAEYSDEFISISQREFEAKCASKLVTKFESCIYQVIREAGLTKSDIDLVLPIGGSCCIPLVRETIKRLFPEERKRANPMFNSLSAVANGAAYQAFQYNTCGVDNDETLIERLPYSIATNLTMERSDFFVRKGDTLPAKTIKTYYLVRDGQLSVRYALYIGEAEKYTHPSMKYIKEANVEVPPNTKVNDFIMKAHFSVSKSGVIQLEVKKEKDGQHLGYLQCQLEMNVLDNSVTTMRRHVLQFCN